MQHTNPRRVFWATIYVFLGVAALVAFCVEVNPEWREWFVANRPIILWCVGWSAIGIGLGLWNDRNAKDELSKSQPHYLMYFPFVWFFASVVAFTAFYTVSDGRAAYAAALAAGLAAGFSGDRLAGILRTSKP